MLGFIEMLRRQPMDSDRLRLALDTIDRSARIQARLVNDLLDMSRIVSGKLQLELAPTDLPALVRLAVDAAQPAAAARQVTLTVAVDPGAGPVQGDADRLRQALDNLLANAIKFTPAGGRVEVQLTGTDQEARLTVADTGIGIAPAFLPHIFGRFRQADGSATRAHGGLGLGLAIAKHLVEQHGGAITADSPGEGRGSTFTLRLPLLARQPPTAGQQGHARRAPR
ncbi:MAG: HAMP domain-containing sensor histidine kinase [Dehalococcoidia bacterium]